MARYARRLSGLACIVFVLAGCAGTTARVERSDMDLQRRSIAVSPYALGKVTYGTDESTFGKTSERNNYIASVKSALKTANVFGDDNSKPYSLDIHILAFSIPSASFGGFPSSLDVQYELKDSNGKVVYSDEVDSTGRDDSGSMFGPTRQNRSRTVAVANNIQSFIERLEQKLQVSVASEPAHAAPRGADANYQSAGGTPVDLAPVKIQSIAAGDIKFGRYHALIIGNDAYQHLPPLKGAVRDAQRLNVILSTQYGFETKVLIDATRDDIVTALTDYRKNLGPNDNLLIYYAGHGWVDKEADEGYWLPVDAESGDPARWLSNATLTTLVRTIEANHILVIADSCFSGKLTRGVNVEIRSNDYLRQMVTRRSRTALTSGGLEPVEDSGGKNGHSVFASALFDALEENSSAIDTSQIFNFVRRQVALHADQFPEYGDIRRAGHEGGDFVFVRRP